MGEIPAGARPFETHGARLRPTSDTAEWVGDCPLCGKVGHFYAEPASERWNCKGCGQSGNVPVFFTRFVEIAFARTSKGQWNQLARERRIPLGILKRRRVAWTGREWIIPCCAKSGLVHDLRRFTKGALKSTAGVKVQLFGTEVLASASPEMRVWLCEGEWDAMAADWLIRQAGLRESDLAVAVPGAGTFKIGWLSHFIDRDIIVCYDADEAGQNGANKVYDTLAEAAGSLRFVRWPDTSPKGWDLRDYAWDAMDVHNLDGAEAVRQLLRWAHKGRPTPCSQIDLPHGEAIARAAAVALEAGEGSPAVKAGVTEPLSLAELLAVFDREMLMSEDTVSVLKVVLATCLSVHIDGDPLWLHVVGPPGAGKTMILQSIQGSPLCIYRSTLTAHSLVSGWRGGKDPSLIRKFSGKVVVLKDLTEVLTLPQTARDEIWGILRGAFDGQVDKTFGNGVDRHYGPGSDPPFKRFVMIAGVTHVIHAHRTASLGERWLKVEFRRLDLAAAQAIQTAALKSIGCETVQETHLQEAVARYLLASPVVTGLPSLGEQYTNRLHCLVQLIAVLRTEVSRTMYTDEVRCRPIPEVGTRLIKQLAKLARILAWMERLPAVNNDVYDLVERVGMDTARGFHADIIDAMMMAGGVLTRKRVTEVIEIPSATVMRRMDDLITIGAIYDAGECDNGAARGRVARTYAVAEDVAELWHGTKGS